MLNDLAAPLRSARPSGEWWALFSWPGSWGTP